MRAALARALPRMHASPARASKTSVAVLARSGALPAAAATSTDMLLVGLGLGAAVACASTAAFCEAADDGSVYLRRNFVADAAAKALPAVVNVTCGVAQRTFGGVQRVGTSAGSGFVVRADGLVVTNAHVVKSAPGGECVVTTNGGRRYRARVLASDAASDLAVLQMANARSLPTIAIGSSGRMRPGDFVVALGSPLNLTNSVTCGIVSNIARHGSEIGAVSSRAEYIQTDAAINQGNSGGPLVDLDGAVVGINTMKAAQADGISFAIPIDAGWAVVRALLAHGRVARPYIGIKMQSAPGGVVVVAVAPGSPADNAGLRPGDRILAFNGSRIANISDVLAKIALSTREARVTLGRPSDGGGGDTLVDATIATAVERLP